MVEIEVVEVKTQRVMRGPAVCRYLGGISMAQLYRLIKLGEFPPPIMLTDGARGWPVEVADQYIERRKAEAYGCRGVA